MARETVRPRSIALLVELMRAPKPGHPNGFSLRDMEERGIGKSMLHRLVTDNPRWRKATCSADLGNRISEVLGVHPSVLFAPVVSTTAGRLSSTAA